MRVSCGTCGVARHCHVDCFIINIILHVKLLEPEVRRHRDDHNAISKNQSQFVRKCCAVSAIRKLIRKLDVSEPVYKLDKNHLISSSGELFGIEDRRKSAKKVSPI